jgi:hypothetical protein
VRDVTLFGPVPDRCELQQLDLEAALFERFLDNVFAAVRSLLVAGAVAVLRHARERATKDGEWVRAMLARKPAKLVAVALANRTSRIVWGDDARPRLSSQRDRRASRLHGPQCPQKCNGEEEVMAKRSSRGSGRPG